MKFRIGKNSKGFFAEYKKNLFSPWLTFVEMGENDFILQGPYAQAIDYFETKAECEQQIERFKKWYDDEFSNTKYTYL